MAWDGRRKGLKGTGDGGRGRDTIGLWEREKRLINNTGYESNKLNVKKKKNPKRDWERTTSRTCAAGWEVNK